MFKRGLRYANKDAKARDLSKEEMMFMGKVGKEMTNLELLKREEQDILARKMIRHHRQNSLQGSGPRVSDGHLTPKRANSFFNSSKSFHGGRDTGNNVMTMIQIIAQEGI